MAKVAPVRVTSRQLAERWGKSDGAIRMMRSAGHGPQWHHEIEPRKRNGKGSRPRGYYLLHEIEAYELKHGRPNEQTVRSAPKGRDVSVRVRASGGD